MPELIPPRTEPSGLPAFAGAKQSRRRLPAALIATVASVAFWLLLWQVASVLELVPPLFLPPP
ncbi:MAG TPA: ABC transporter permease, partial [Rhodospirillales bacterium]|nr:ABC transporter permease [Rhodospirillales bacterium]